MEEENEDLELNLSDDEELITAQKVTSKINLIKNLINLQKKNRFWKLLKMHG